MARQRNLSPERKVFINSFIEHYQPNDLIHILEELEEKYFKVSKVPC